jgi:hypothetical protein
MRQPSHTRKIFFLLALGGSFFLLAKTYSFFSRPLTQNWTVPQKIFLNDNDLLFETTSSAKTVGDFLTEKKIALGEHDQVFPEKEAHLTSGKIVRVLRARKIKILVAGQTLEKWTLQKTVAGVIAENNIQLGRLDKVSPETTLVPVSNAPIVITRIDVEEKIVNEEIAFKEIANEDNSLNWREKKITQTGEKGLREIKYRITYKNSKEVERIVLEKKIIKEPVAQIVTQGTLIKTGKTHKGVASWYAWKGGLFAANPWLPMGSYVKVTNPNNNKSVIVQINDRGPFGNGRIIDLDKVAFARIAPIGAGVANIIMEEIIN